MGCDFVATARDFAPRIIALRDQTESERCLAPGIVEELQATGLCRMLLEEGIGGPEVNPRVWLEVLEELATAEASVAWIVWNAGAPSMFGQYLEPGARKQIFGDQQGMYASSSRPTGRAVVVDDGYRVSGRWTLVSGCMHATEIGVMCVEEKGGEMVTSPEGAPMMRMVFVPPDQCEIVDTWNVGGLRGTGSHDLVVDDLHVDSVRTLSPFLDRRIDHPLGRLPIAGTMSSGHAACCLGVARGAFEDVAELGRTKVSVDPVPDMRDREGNQRELARIGAAIGAARAQLHNQVEALWEAAQNGAPIPPSLMADVWSAAIHAAETSRSAVENLSAIAGTPALYVDFPLERRLRDVQAMTQHIMAQPLWLEQAGRVHMGLEPSNPLFMI